MKGYIIKDSYGNIIRKFPTFQQASVYKQAYGNIGWTIEVNQ